MVDFTQARQNMVDSQLRTNKIVNDQLINAFLSVPRECFVEKGQESIAYIDKDVSVGLGRYLIAPMVLAQLMQSLKAQPDEVALDVGCATGYSSAILAHLVMTVVALENENGLALTANDNFTNLAVDNAVVVEGKLNEGYATQGPYDVIYVGGSISTIPPCLIDQLSEGGRLGAIIGDSFGTGKAILVAKKNGTVSERVLFDATVSLLPGFEAQKGFIF